MYGPEECEAVLGSSKMLNKPIQYSFLSAWIGDGVGVSCYRQPKQIWSAAVNASRIRPLKKGITCQYLGMFPQFPCPCMQALGHL
ncbi:hypothetical protein ANCDUO_05334 [Ancylostoma duodenale]|uniref:Uncharacterized protein n=1 Tax=Ancylostoma duodenale TaxID=51022 RepID=A0A0C2GYY9_9BILA|nr:hypothetical protein ANCDUO_05334 [Ancylostoma duodenale]